MKVRIVALFILIFFICAFQYSCSRRNITGWGQDGDIYVLADSTIWNDISPILSQTFEKQIITPQNETIFTIHRANLDKFKRYKN